MKFFKKYTLALAIASLCLSSSNVSSMNYRSEEQPEKVWHISHKTLLGCFKKYGLDIEKLWDKHNDPFGEKPVVNPIKINIVNFFSTLQENLLLEQFAKKETSLFERMSTSYTERLAQFRDQKLMSILYNFFKQELNLKFENDLSNLTDLLGELDFVKMASITEAFNKINTQTIDDYKPLKIECINKIKNLDEDEMFHSVSIDNVAPIPSEIFKALSVIISYHFTDKSLEKRLSQDIEDNTVLSLPLLVIRITQKDYEPSSKSNQSLTSLFARPGHEQFRQFCSPECRLFQETELPRPGRMQKMFCNLGLACIFLNPIAAIVNTLIPFSPEAITVQPETINATTEVTNTTTDVINTTTEVVKESTYIPCVAPQNVCFTTTNNLSLCCDLYEDLSLLCCNQEIPTQCISFNMLDNDNPLNNCCTANTQGITCSIDLCSDHDAIVGPCSHSGELTNKSISQTYGSAHNNLVKAMHEISTMKSSIDNAIVLVRDKDNDICITLSPSSLSANTSIATLAKYMRYIEKNLNINSCNHIKKLIVHTNHTDYAAVDSNSVNDCSQSPDSDMLIFLSSKYEAYPSFDFVIGHEIAHVHQAQSLLIHNTSLDDRLLRPGFEISADILGSLASNYSNLAAVAMQWLFYNNRTTENMVCSIQLYTINRENAGTINNLLRIHNSSSPHPNINIRGAILLKLSTMIKAAVKYLEQQEKSLGNEA